jgi:hypothetical protein
MILKPNPNGSATYELSRLQLVVPSKDGQAYFTDSLTNDRIKPCSALVSAAVGLVAEINLRYQAADLTFELKEEEVRVFDQADKVLYEATFSQKGKRRFVTFSPLTEDAKKYLENFF